MPDEIDLDNFPPFPERLPEKLKAIRERLGLTPDEIAPKVGAKTGAEILAYENDEDDLLVSVLWGYCKLAGVPLENLWDDRRDQWLGHRVN
jgi:transcriptional regulator with XRE-family HTH domain